MRSGMRMTERIKAAIAAVTPMRAVLASALVAYGVLTWIFFDSFKPASDRHIEIAIALLASGTVPFVVAIGVLFGRPLLAAVIAVVLFLLWIGWCALAISMFGI